MFYRRRNGRQWAADSTGPWYIRGHHFVAPCCYLPASLWVALVYCLSTLYFSAVDSGLPRVRPVEFPMFPENNVRTQYSTDP